MLKSGVTDGFRLFQFQNERQSHVVLSPARTYGESEVGVEQIEIDPRLTGILEYFFLRGR